MSEPLGWKLGLGENGFASALDFYGTAYDQAKVWEAAVNLGFDGVELHPRYHPVPAPAEVLRELRHRADDTGLRISGIQTQGPNPCLGPTEAETYVDMLKRAIDGAVILGADVVGCWPGGSMPEIADAEKIDSLAEAYRQVAPIAQSAGVILSLEPEPVVIVDSIDMAMGLVEAVASPAFTLLYDVAHATVLGNADPVAVLERLGGHIGHVHFTDADGSCLVMPDGSPSTSTHLAPGEGNVDLTAVLEGLRHIGYTRWVQADVWQHPDPFAAAAKSVQYIRQWVQKAAETQG